MNRKMQAPCQGFSVLGQYTGLQVASRKNIGSNMRPFFKKKFRVNIGIPKNYRGNIGTTIGIFNLLLKRFFINKVCNINSISTCYSWKFL